MQLSYSNKPLKSHFRKCSVITIGEIAFAKLFSIIVIKYAFGEVTIGNAFDDNWKWFWQGLSWARNYTLRNVEDFMYA